MKLQVDVIEDLGSGAVYCQLLDAAFGQRVPMQKVNWKAKFEYEFIANLKVFQTTLERLGITKKIDVHILTKYRFKSSPEQNTKTTFKWSNGWKDTSKLVGV